MKNGKTFLIWMSGTFLLMVWPYLKIIKKEIGPLVYPDMWYEYASISDITLSAVIVHFGLAASWFCVYGIIHIRSKRE